MKNYNIGQVLIWNNEKTGAEWYKVIEYVDNKTMIIESLRTKYQFKTSIRSVHSDMRPATKLDKVLK